MSDPYRALGLARNPFVCDDPRSLPQALWCERDLPGPPRPAGRRLVQVMGERGAGKTALLSHWRARTSGRYIWVPPGRRRWMLPPVGSLIYWDEADRLPCVLLFLSLYRAARAGATVVAATHHDLAPLAARAGLATETITLPEIDAAAVRAWAERRIAAALLPGTDATPLALDTETAAAIASASGGSWRVVGDYLHVWAAEAAARQMHTRTVTR